VNCYIEGTTDFIFGRLPLYFKTVLSGQKQIPISLLLVQRKTRNSDLFFLIVKIITDSAVTKLFLGSHGGLMQKTFLFVASYQKQLLPKGGITGITRIMKKLFFMLNIKTPVKARLYSKGSNGQNN
jgi:pectinesterase